MTALLQVALDVVSLREAIRIARLSVKGGADILEAGTPLIKSVGLISVEVLKEAFPEKIVVADLKTMDAGRLEASLAFEKGADIVTVMALATMETITEVVETAREYGGKVMVDLMNVSNPFLEAKKLSEINTSSADFKKYESFVDILKDLDIELSEELEAIFYLLDENFIQAYSESSEQYQEILHELKSKIGYNLNCLYHIIS